jgi:hypothetical protein
MSENNNLLLARELKQAINQMVLDNDQILYNADLMYGINSDEAKGMRENFSKDENDLMMIRQIMLTDKDFKYKHTIQSMIRNLDTAVRDYIPVSIIQHYTDFEIFNKQ